MVRRTFTITMEDDLMKECKDHAYKLGIPNSHFIEQCVIKGLKEAKEQTTLDVE